MFTRRRGRLFAANAGRLGVTAFALFFVAPQTVAAQSAHDVEVLKEILHTYEKREGQLNPVWVRFHSTHWESVAWRRAAEPHETPEEIRWTDEGEFACKGNKRRTWAKGGRPSPTKEWAGERLYIYNGEVEISKLPNEDVYSFKKQPDGTLAAEPPFRIAGEHQLLSDLTYWSAGKPVNVSVSPAADMDGAIIVELRYPMGSRNRYWLLPEKGWSIKRREAYNAQNGPMNFSEIQETGVLHGIPYPKRGRREEYLNTKELGATVEFDVDSIETSAAQIPDRLFLVEIPKTASIYDEDLKVMVRNNEITESHLKEVVARAAGRSDWTWWLWGSAGVAVLGLTGLTVWLFCRRRR